MAISCSADWDSPFAVFSRIAFHSANTVAPLLKGAAPVRGRRRNRSPTAHSDGATSSIATSSMTASPDPSRSTTLRPSSSEITRTSPPRCSKRRRLIWPVAMTCPDPMLVTRPIDRKTRRLPVISTTRPTTVGLSSER